MNRFPWPYCCAGCILFWPQCVCVCVRDDTGVLGMCGRVVNVLVDMLLVNIYSRDSRFINSIVLNHGSHYSITLYSR